MLDPAFRWTVRYLLPAFNYFYRLKENNRPKKIITWDIWYIFWGKYKKILGTVEEYQPDYILGVHFFPPIILGELKKQGKLSVRVGNVLTDYTVSPYIEKGVGVEDFLIPA
ncbi:MAG: hypothetical protein IJ856_02155 [Candidatus Methanomethylophilaceae archaeon]|nr:hypothetical protein [Candidatus Methanomethylophilaceae archaeon]